MLCVDYLNETIKSSGFYGKLDSGYQLNPGHTFPSDCGSSALCTCIRNETHILISTASHDPSLLRDWINYVYGNIQTTSRLRINKCINN